MSDKERISDPLTVQEAHELTGYNDQHIRWLARNNKIKAEKFGQSWMISRESLLTWFNSDEAKKRQTPDDKP